MFVHSVYFWLAPEMTTEQRAGFFRDIETLRAIDGVRGCYIGTPVPSTRPVIDSSYDCALVLLFDDQAAEEAYLADPIHCAFANAWRPLWTVKIYDFVQ
jgi:hypothetical protein